MKILDKIKLIKAALFTKPVMASTIPKNMTKEQAIEYVTHGTGYYKIVKSDYRDDQWDTGVYKEYVPPLGKLDKKWCKDKDVVLAAVLNDYRSFDYVSDELKKDVDIINAYKQRNISDIDQLFKPLTSDALTPGEITQNTPINNYTDGAMPITLEEQKNTPYVQQTTSNQENGTVSENSVTTNSVQPNDLSIVKNGEQQFSECDDLERTAFEWSEHKRKSR